MKGVIVVKVDRCVACKTCEIACAVEHSESKDLAGALTESPRPVARLSVEGDAGFAVPLQCRQCREAPCVAVCPTHALNRQDQDSPVIIDHELCIGCNACVLVCPFGVIRMDPTSCAIIKCDACAHRLERDECPACVSSCPTDALEFKALEDVVAAGKSGYLLSIERATSRESQS